MKKETKQKLKTMTKKLGKLTPHAEMKKMQSKIKVLEEKVFALEQALIQILFDMPTHSNKN